MNPIHVQRDRMAGRVTAKAQRRQPPVAKAPVTLRLCGSSSPEGPYAQRSEHARPRRSGGSGEADVPIHDVKDRAEDRSSALEHYKNILSFVKSALADWR